MPLLGAPNRELSTAFIRGIFVSDFEASYPEILAFTEVYWKFKNGPQLSDTTSAILTAALFIVKSVNMVESELLEIKIRLKDHSYVERDQKPR